MGIAGFFRTLLFIVAFYYLFKFIGRFVLPYVMKKGFEKMQQQQQNGAGSFQEKARQEEGKVTIKRNAQKKNSETVSTNDGEYIDYEEVK